MFEAVDRFHSNAKQRSGEISRLNETFGFSNQIFRIIANIETHMNKFKNIYVDDVDYFEVLEETAGLSVSTMHRHHILK